NIDIKEFQILKQLAKNLSQVQDLVQSLTNTVDQIELNQTRETGHGTRPLYKAPAVVDHALTKLNQTNATGLVRNSTLAQPLDISQIYQLNLQNSKQIHSLSQNFSIISKMVFNLA